MQTNNTNTQNTRINIMPEAKAIFKTILLLNEKFGVNYLTQILKGHERFPLKKAEHGQLETFGALKHLNETRIRNLISWLVAEQYLYTKDFTYGIIGITAKGKERLNSEQAWNVKRYLFSQKTEDSVLANSLKELRKSWAIMWQKAPFEIFTDYVLDTIVREKPQHITELKTIQGLGTEFVDSHGQVILRAVKNSKKEAENLLHEQLLKRVQYPAYQQIKSLFLTDMSLVEIEQASGKKEENVIRMLVDLHNAGEIDLKDFIEENINAKDLHAAVSFFEQTEEPRLKVAYETLGLSYDTLRLCRLYVNCVKQQKVAI